MTDFVDPYCWPGSSVLRNLLELKKQVELTEAEYAFTLERAVDWPADELPCVQDS